HEVDKHLLKRLAALDLGYLGMIGSKSKAKSMLREAEAEGVPRDRLSRVRAPIGLDLGKTKDPAAVALSILAEVTQVLHAARAISAAATTSLSPAPDVLSTDLQRPERA